MYYLGISALLCFLFTSEKHIFQNVFVSKSIVISILFHFLGAPTYRERVVSRVQNVLHDFIGILQPLLQGVLLLQPRQVDELPMQK